MPTFVEAKYFIQTFLPYELGCNNNNNKTSTTIPGSRIGADL